MILFSQQETPNWLSTYASFNLPPPRATFASPPLRPIPFLFSFIRFLSSLLVLFDSFRRCSRSVTFQSVPAVSWTIFGFITFSRLRPTAIFANGGKRIGVVFCPASNEICEGPRRVTMKGPMSASADHVIILLRKPPPAHRTGISGCRACRIRGIACDIRHGSRREFATNEKKSRDTDHRRDWFAPVARGDRGVSMENGSYGKH